MAASDATVWVGERAPSTAGALAHGATPPLRGTKDSGAGGLGSSIVEALARQLHARVKLVDRKPGTEVSVVHTQIAAVDSSQPVERAV